MVITHVQDGWPDPGGLTKRILLALGGMAVTFVGTAGFFSCLWGILAFTEFQTIYPGAEIGGGGGEIFIMGAVYLAPLLAVCVFIVSLCRAFSRNSRLGVRGHSRASGRLPI